MSGADRNVGAMQRDVSSPAVLYVNSTEPNCGVYQFGRAIATALSKSAKFRFVYCEVGSPDALAETVAASRPVAVCYNYNPLTMPWLKRRVIAAFPGPQIGTIHEITQAAADAATDIVFDYHIAPDPTLLLKNPLVFKTGRLLATYQNTFPPSPRPVIGTWGFGYSGKGFEQVVRAVQQEFDEATIRIHIPVSPYMDPQGALTKEIADRCRALVVKPGVDLSVTHEFLAPKAMLDVLAQNSLNAFFYAENLGRGISSVLDMALAVDRPIALTRSSMFRHVFDAKPSIFVEDRTLREIMSSGTEPLRRFKDEWTPENLAWDYDRIVTKALDAHQSRQKLGTVSLLKRRARAHRIKLVRKLARHFTKEAARLERKANGPWAAELNEQRHRPRVADPAKGKLAVSSQGPRRYNFILDDAARRKYAPVIALLHSLAPELMARKIAAANIQQAFVFDAVRALAPADARILSVGSFEDTACVALKMVGVAVEEIDPVINYDLDDFIARPSTVKQSYDVVFATSVIEHVEDDETFMRHLSELLKPNGVMILTCDYNDQYKPGDEIPDVCHRMYTQKDFRERIIPSARQCVPVDNPDWDCPNPDFVLGNRFRYTFATLALRKSAS